MERNSRERELAGRDWRLTRRAALGTIGAGALGFLAFGGRGREEIPRGRLVLDYWEKWTGHEGAAMQRIVDAFNRSQDRLWVRYLITNTIHQKALVAILGGAPPDLLGMYAFNVPSYAEAGAVLALDDLARDAGLSLDQYASGMRGVMRYAGSWYGVVNTGGTLALYWNKEIFRECAERLLARGLHPDRAPRTVQELELANEVLSRVKGGGKPGTGELERVGFLHLEPGWWSWIWGYLFGGSLVDSQARAACASDEFVRAYEWMQRTSGLMGVNSVERFRSGLGPFGTPQQGFLTGEVAMVVQGPWLANQVVAFRPDLDYGVAPLPVDESMLDEQRPMTCIDTDVLMIPRGARRPEASMEFIAYTQRRENVEALATAHCKGSPLLDVSEEFLRTHPNRGVRLHTQMAASPRAFIAPPIPTWPQYKDIFDSAVHELWTHQATPASKLREVQTRAQAVLDLAAQRRRLRGESGA